MRKRTKKIEIKDILFMSLIFLPALIRVLSENITISEKIIHRMNTGYTDFSYLIKARYLYVIAALMLIVIIYDMVNKKIDIKEFFKNKVIWAFSLYLLMVTLSSLMTEYKDIAFTGIYERYEGWLTIFGYLIVFIFAYLFINDKRMIKIAKTMSIVTLIMSIIGILQYFKLDPFQWTISKYFYLPVNMLRAISNLKFDFNQGQAYTTLFNPNYVGSYMVLVLPLLMYYFTKFKNRNWEIITLFSMISAVVVIFAAKSSAGILGLAFLLFFLMLILILNQNFKKHRKKIVVGLVLTLIIGGSVFMEPIKEFVNDIMSPIRAAQEGQKVERLLEMKNNGQYFTMVFKDGKELNMQLNESNTPIFTDNDRNMLLTEYNSEKNIANFYDENYKFLAIKYFKDNVVGVAVNKWDLNRSSGYVFVKMRYLNSHIVNPYNEKIDYSREIASFAPLNGYEKIGTSRGYIWSRSIPLLKNTMIIGYGPDAYSLAFPQDDIFGKINYMIDPYIVVDKPHNMYLGIGINTGVVSLVAFLTGLGIILVNSFRFRKKDLALKFLLLGVSAYLLTQMFNDSSVAIMPIFYLILGIMLSKIEKIKKAKNN